MIATRPARSDDLAGPAGGHELSPSVGETEADLRRWATDTWAALAAMVSPGTGLPADHIGSSVRQPRRSGMTSPTNIGGYLWSTVAAREMGLIEVAECRQRLSQTITTLREMRRHASTGMFYNWYDGATGRQLEVFPGDGRKVAQFLSSVDNGWLAAGLTVARAAEPAVADIASQLLRQMDFASFYDARAAPGSGAGLLRGGFWETRPPDVQVAQHTARPDVFYTAHHYSLLNSETRIASYVGIARDQLPPEHYFAMERGPRGSADPSSQVHRGIRVRQGSVDYRGMRIVPTWGGSMFEALMPDLLVPEANWGPRSFGVNHPLTVRAQREFGLLDAGYRYWGFSPASRPGGGYQEWGVAPIGTGGGYPSDLAGTADADVRAGRTAYGDGVITPHALFLALQYEPAEVVDCLRRVESEFDAYGDGGFYDAVAVKSGSVADRYLALDQSMILAATGNYLADDALRRYFCTGAVERKVRPLLAEENFAAGLIR